MNAFSLIPLRIVCTNTLFGPPPKLRVYHKRESARQLTKRQTARMEKQLARVLTKNGGIVSGESDI